MGPHRRPGAPAHACAGACQEAQEARCSREFVPRVATARQRTIGTRTQP